MKLLVIHTASSTKSTVWKIIWREKGLRAKNKSVKCYAVPENVPKYLVFLLNPYIEHLPKYAYDNDVLYLRPKFKCPSYPDALRYEEKPETSISSKTNQGLRATVLWYTLCCTAPPGRVWGPKVDRHHLLKPQGHHKSKCTIAIYNKWTFIAMLYAFTICLPHFNVQGHIHNGVVKLYKSMTKPRHKHWACVHIEWTGKGHKWHQGSTSLTLN